MKKIVVISLVIILLLTTVSAFNRRDSDCASCHYSSSGSAGYAYRLPVIIVDAPMFVDLDKEFTVNVGVEFSDYEIEELTIRLLEDGDIFDFEDDSIHENNIKKSSTFPFICEAKTDGVSTLTVKVNALVHYDHTGGDTDDYREERIEKSCVITVGTLSLVPSSWSVYFEGENEKITLTAKKDISDLRMISPDNLDIEPLGKDSLQGGEKIDIVISPRGNVEVDEKIIFTWTEDGNPHAIAIQVTYGPETQREKDYNWIFGRIGGIASLILLIFSIILGGTWNTSRYLKRVISPRKRIRYHCVISWFLFALALYHGLILLFGPYSRHFWNTWVVLGYISALAMLVTGITGSFMKFFIRNLGPGKWRKLHLYSTLIALFLGTIHGIRIGTDLRFVRESTFLGKYILVVLVLVAGTAVIMNLLAGKKKGKSGKIDASPSLVEERNDFEGRNHVFLDYSTGGADYDYDDMRRDRDHQDKYWFKIDFEGDDVDYIPEQNDNNGDFMDDDHGKIDFNEDYMDYDRGQTDYDEGYMDYDRGQTDYDEGNMDYDRGKTDYDENFKEYDRGQTDYDGDLMDYDREQTDHDRDHMDYDREQTDHDRDHMDHYQDPTDHDEDHGYYENEYERRKIKEGPLYPEDGHIVRPRIKTDRGTNRRIVRRKRVVKRIKRRR